MVGLKLQQFQYALKKIFHRAFGAWCFPCFFVKVTVPRVGGGGLQWEGVLHRGGDYIGGGLNRGGGLHRGGNYIGGGIT